MRMLLEVHYDQVHLEKWQAKHKEKKAPERKSEYKVFRSVIQSRLGHLNERISLPANVKNVLCKQEDESDWGKLEALRRIICSELEGEVSRTFESREELDDLITAIINRKKIHMGCVEYEVYCHGEAGPVDDTGSVYVLSTRPLVLGSDNHNV